MSQEVEQLLAKIKAIEEDPASQESPGSLWLHNARARKKLDALRREIAGIIRQEKLARGETVNDAGYSGRQTNKR